MSKDTETRKLKMFNSSRQGPLPRRTVVVERLEVAPVGPKPVATFEMNIKHFILTKCFVWDSSQASFSFRILFQIHSYRVCKWSWQPSETAMRGEGWKCSEHSFCVFLFGKKPSVFLMETLTHSVCIFLSTSSSSSEHSQTFILSDEK